MVSYDLVWVGMVWRFHESLPIGEGVAYNILIRGGVFKHARDVVPEVDVVLT